MSAEIVLRLKLAERGNDLPQQISDLLSIIPSYFPTTNIESNDNPKLTIRE